MAFNAAVSSAATPSLGGAPAAHDVGMAGTGYTGFPRFNHRPISDLEYEVYDELYPVSTDDEESLRTEPLTDDDEDEEEDEGDGLGQRPDVDTLLPDEVNRDQDHPRLTTGTNKSSPANMPFASKVASHITLTDLPRELLLNTFKHLALPRTGDIGQRNTGSHSKIWTKLKDLASVCRTCKMFQPLATPLLYQTFPMPGTVRYDYKGRPNMCPILRLRFLRTLIERPEYRQLVKNVFAEIFTTGLGIGPRYHANRRHGLQKPFKDLLAETARQLPSGSVREESITNISNGTKLGDQSSTAADVEIALILCLLKDIKELSVSFLHVNDSENEHCSALWCMDSKALSTPEHQFHQLEKLSIMSLRHKFGMDCTLWPRLSNILNLPMLRSFRGSGSFDYWSDWATECTWSTMRSITLHACFLPLYVIEDLLRRCSSLQSLELLDCYFAPTSFKGKTMGNDFISKTSLSSLVDALRIGAKTLQVLKVDDTHVSKIDTGELDVLGSFQSFTALRVLDVTEEALLGCINTTPSDHHGMVVDTFATQADLSELMPPNLELLELRYCTPLSLGRLGLAAGQFESRLPLLKRIAMSPQYPSCCEMGTTPEANRLHESLNAVGIALTFYFPNMMWGRIEQTDFQGPSA